LHNILKLTDGLGTDASELVKKLPAPAAK